MELILSSGYKFAKQCHVVVVESSSLTLSLVLNTKMGKEAGEVIFYIKPLQNDLNEEWGGTFCISKFYNVCSKKLSIHCIIMTEVITGYFDKILQPYKKSLMEYICSIESASLT